MSATKLTVVYDNQLYERNLKCGWGFSSLVEHAEKRILFDTGDNAEKLLFNLNELEGGATGFDLKI